MKLPFSLDQFLEVFRAYNAAIWPAQFLLYAVGVGLVAAARFRGGRGVVPLGLAGLWAWTGGVYHIRFFSTVNPAARLFGGLFLVQAAVWLLAFGSHDRSFRPTPGLAGWVGATVLVYAFAGYPILNTLLGHAYPSMPTFGAPCPTAIATFGLLCWSSPRPPWWVWPIPLAWAVVATSAAVSLGMREDFGLPASALAAVLIAIRRPALA